MNVAPGSKTSSTAKIREATLDDYEKIAELQRANGMPPKSKEQWEHLWANNPVYLRHEKWPIGWVSENEEKQIVGYIGNIPLSFYLQDRELMATCIHGMVAEPAYRSAGGFLLRRLLNQKTVDFILTNTANSNSAKLNAAFRQPQVPAGQWDRSVYWITNYHGFVASALKSKSWPQMLAAPAAVLLKLRHRLAKSNGWMERDAGRVEVCYEFDERFDYFWEKLKWSHPDRLLADRSRQVLQWHFHYPLAEGNAWVTTMSENGTLSAYAVFCRQDNSEFGLQRVRLVDFQVLGENTQLLLPMLAWAVAECERRGIHMLEAFGFRPEKQSVIESVAPFRREFDWWWYFYKGVRKEMVEQLQDAAIWDPSQYDGDASL